jgi:hypothetical protein
MLCVHTGVPELGICVQLGVSRRACCAKRLQAAVHGRPAQLVVPVGRMV